MAEVGITDMMAFIEVTEDEIAEYMDHPVAQRKSRDRGTALRDEAAKLAAGNKLRNYDGLDPRKWTTKDPAEVKVPVITGIVE